MPIRKLSILLIAICTMIFFAACVNSGNGDNSQDGNQITVYEDKEYSAYQEVASYIHEFKHLPSNYLTKAEANARGCNGGNPQVTLGGNVYIGGDRYMNFEGLLPEDAEYYECDVDYSDEYRGAKRLVFTEEGTVYYTENHYGQNLEPEEMTFDNVFVKLYD